ncbi:MAG TPA: DNA-3-methyladenine glycosylase [Nitrososphaeraceae archaeon]|jgi:DNA-3-methyladenine glycosylase II|nr:DNA-3-methyladenine glycosylase [Nitrososphaeraceae archaeon]
MESCNIDAIQYLCKADSNIEKIIKIVGKYSIKIRNDPFQSLIESIIYQQLAGKAANAIYNRFLNYYDNKQVTPARILNSPNDNLKKVGLSNRKIDYLKDLASHVYDGRINLEEFPTMNDEEIINKLVNVKGIGRWTSEMFLIFSLGRQDVLPVTDLGVRKAIYKVYSLSELPKPDTMMEIAEPWRPYRSIATWYLWKSLSNFNTIG